MFIFDVRRNKHAQSTALEEYVLKMVLEVRNDLLFSELRPLKVMNKSEISVKSLHFCPNTIDMLAYYVS